MGEVFIKKCKSCGETFESDTKFKRLCPQCRDAGRKKMRQNQSEQHRKTLSIRHCHYCGVEFEGTNQLYCPMCRNMDRKEQQGQPNEALHKMNALCELYNKNHGTNYSYGQFVLGMYLGKINVGVVKNE